MMRKFFALALAIVILTSAQGAFSAAKDTEEGNASLTALNRELLQSVEKGCVYIWAMGPGDVGFMQPLWIGSGVIFMAVPEENAAYALTNHHVASNTALLQVETWDRSTYKAQLVAAEPGLDCALIRIENIARDRYEPCVLGNSDTVQNGELALAVGAPGSAEGVNIERMDPLISFGLHQTATMRVISGRQTDPYEFVGAWAYWKDDLGEQVMTNCPWRFMTQTPLSGGNSGGPLFNAAGEVVALNHAGSVAGSRIAQLHNYAIPINFCKSFAFDVLNTGEYQVPWLGIDVIVPPELKNPSALQEFIERFLDREQLRVLGVRKNSPAETAGFAPGDVIEELDGRTFADSTELRLYVLNLEVGAEVPVVVKRGKQELDLRVTVGPKRKYDSEFSL